MFECKGFDDSGVCIAMPRLGRLHGAGVCEECLEKGLGECRFMERVELRDAACQCYYVKCHCEECPAIEGQIDKLCNPRRCKFYEQEEST